MEIEAGMGAAAAVQELLMHTCRGVNYLFSGAPASWEHASSTACARPAPSW